jgi:hypothetical protein
LTALIWGALFFGVHFFLDLKSKMAKRLAPFHYTNWLTAEGKTPYDTTTRNVYEVEFPITAYGEVVETARWKQPVTQAQAIAAVERYLSQPLTDAYFETLREQADLNMTWPEAKKDFPRRADLLGGHVFLESADVDKNGKMELITGT